MYELASAFLGIDHSRLYHDGKVRRTCALRQARSLDELAGRKPVGFMLNQQAEGFEPGGMYQRSERRQRGFSIHASASSDDFAGVDAFRKNTRVGRRSRERVKRWLVR